MAGGFRLCRCLAGGGVRRIKPLLLPPGGGPGAAALPPLTGGFAAAGAALLGPGVPGGVPGGVPTGVWAESSLESEALLPAAGSFNCRDLPNQLIHETMFFPISRC